MSSSTVRIEYEDFVDLTDSFILSEHQVLSNVVIVLDDSQEEPVKQAAKSKKKPRPMSASTSNSTSSLTTTSTPKAKGSQSSRRNTSSERAPLGHCPICWDVLGRKQLGSTKCGHVFCLQCLKRAMRIHQTCPKCRTALIGKDAFHALYLDLCDF